LEDGDDGSAAKLAVALNNKIPAVVKREVNLFIKELCAVITFSRLSGAACCAPTFYRLTLLAVLSFMSVILVIAF
jgi:hypothetical protein